LPCFICSNQLNWTFYGLGYVYWLQYISYLKLVKRSKTLLPEASYIIKISLRIYAAGGGVIRYGHRYLVPMIQNP